MNFQLRANKLAASLGGVDNIVGMEAGEQLLVIRVAHMEYVEIQRIQAAPFVSEVLIGLTSVSILTNDGSAQALVSGLRLSETGRMEVEDPPFKLTNLLRKLFIPLLSTIMAGGVIQGFMVLLLSFAIYRSAVGATETLSVIYTLVFMILPVLIAFSSARYFKTNPYIAAAIAGIMIQPTITNFVADRILNQFLKFPLIQNHQFNTILPVLILVPFLAYINRQLTERMTGTLLPVIRPCILMGLGLIFGVIILLPLMALASHISVSLFIMMAERIPFLATALMGFLGPLFVLTGSHYSFFEAATQAIESTGYDMLLGPGMLISNAAHAGVALALTMKSRKKLYRYYTGLSFVLSLLGVTQPIMYGGELILKNLLWYVMIGGGAGGLLAGLFDLRIYQFVNPNITSLPAFVDDSGNLFVAISCMVVAALIAYFLTMMRPLVELTDEEIRIATSGQGLDVIE
ncbi:PTS transporter subunit EIIC [Jeotgalibaca sp. A122]|uniref:PTS transporter subunit EIIC n=1 Tax=Jeotgalibaca sp. A122 TaxID=3457322 RepID=UPI003FD3E4FC